MRQAASQRVRRATRNTLAREPIAGAYSLPQMVRDLRRYQSELEIQNKALRYSQASAEGASERFLTLFSNVPLALLVVDENGLVLQSNAMALRLFRPLETDAPLNFLLPLVSSDHADKVTSALARARTGGTSQTTEIVFRCGSDGVVTGDLHVARIDGASVDLAHFICVVVDQTPLLAERRALRASTTELQQKNEELELSKNRLAAIINSSLDAIICVDQAYRITIFNPTAATLFQCPPVQALGSQLARFLPDAVKALSYRKLATHAQLGEMNGLSASGNSIPIEVSVSFELHPDGDTTTIFARDLTGRKKIEAHRNALESQLRESQKMQAVGTMAGGIAHDFNNIIGAILGNVELARQDVGADSLAQVSLSEIDKAGRRARDLVRQILTFSRNEVPKLIPTQLADVVQETAHLLKVTLPPMIEVIVRCDPATPLVLADATQVEQALLNLCANAIQSIGAGRGRVSIDLGYDLPVDGVALERRSGARGPHVRLVVTDNGAGMDAATLERIFEPFFTTKPVGQGTGLGLAVVHGIMRNHGGTVVATSAPDRGSLFTLYFPVAGSASLPVVAPAVRVSTRPSPGGAGKHILYVDDDEALVFLVERVLKRRGFLVSTFTDPRLAVQALRSPAFEFDLLVTDYNMPGYSGLELLREARLIRPDLPVALASGYVTAEIEQSALSAGARALIYKPNDVDELCEIVQQLLQGAAAG